MNYFYLNEYALSDPNVHTSSIYLESHRYNIV
jgi:hypothetical protein